MSSVELKPPVFESQKPQREELPIESTFPIDPEISFRRLNNLRTEDHPDFMTEMQVDYYQVENLICFLCEFAGKVPYKKIPGILTDDGRLEICNLDVIQLAENSVRAAPPEWRTRLTSEKIGWEMALNSIAMGANTVHIVSPPSIADYMLTFSVHVQDRDEQIGGRRVQQVVTRFDESQDSLEESSRVFDTLATQAHDPTQARMFEVGEDFLEHPICSYSDNPRALFDTVKLLGITDDDILYSEQYEMTVRQTLEPMILSYLDLMRQASKYDPHGSFDESQKYDHFAHTLDQELKTIFSFAKQIAAEVRRSMKGEAEQGATVRDVLSLHTHDPDQYYQYVQWMMIQNPPVLEGGSQCLSVNSQESYTSVLGPSSTGGSPLSMGQLFHTIFGSDKSFWENLRGNSHSKKGEALCVTCPHCNNKDNNTQKRDGTYVCGNDNCPTNKARK